MKGSWGLDLLPDEIVLRVLEELDPDSVLTAVPRVSRRLARIARDEGLWTLFCARTLATATTDNSPFRADVWVRADDGESMLDFWRSFLRFWDHRLGWWAEINGSHGAVFRLAADMQFGVLRCEQLILANVLDRGAPPDDAAELPRGAILDRSVLAIPTDAASDSFLDIHLLYPTTQFVEIFNVHYDAEDGVVLESDHYSAADCKVTDTILLRPWAHINAHAPRPPFPSPAMVSALRIATPSPEHLYDWSIVTLQIDPGPHSLFPIRAPSSLHLADPPDAPLRSGWYSGTYGAHGCELIYIRTTTVPEGDHSLPHWPWDVLPADAPVQGLRIEGVKLTGDPNVPKGQRSFVGFLSSPKARRGQIPERSSRSLYSPWPIVEQKPGDAGPGLILQDLYSCETGWTAPGYGRIAARWFRDPRWTQCVVHIASRVEIQLFWLEMGIVTTFHRLGIENDDR